MNYTKPTAALASAMMFAMVLFGQDHQPPVPYVDGKVKYTEVVPVENNTSGQLYGKAKLWFASAFKSAQDVIQLDDKENGIVLGQGIVVQDEAKALTHVRKTWHFTIKIQVKDGRYRAEIYDITYTFEQPGNNVGLGASTIDLDPYFLNPKIYKKDGTMKPVVADFAQETNDYMNGFLASIKTAMMESMESDF